MLALTLALACAALDTGSAAPDGSPVRLVYEADPARGSIPGIRTDGPYQVLHCVYDSSGPLACRDESAAYIRGDGLLCSSGFSGDGQCSISLLVADEVRITYW